MGASFVIIDRPIGERTTRQRSGTDTPPSATTGPPTHTARPPVAPIHDDDDTNQHQTIAIFSVSTAVPRLVQTRPHHENRGPKIRIIAGLIELEDRCRISTPSRCRSVCLSANNSSCRRPARTPSRKNTTKRDQSKITANRFQSSAVSVPRVPPRLRPTAPGDAVLRTPRPPVRPTASFCHANSAIHSAPHSPMPSERQAPTASTRRRPHRCRASLRRQSLGQRGRSAPADNPRCRASSGPTERPATRKSCRTPPPRNRSANRHARQATHTPAAQSVHPVDAHVEDRKPVSRRVSPCS